VAIQTRILEDIVSKEIDTLVTKLLKKFDEEIIDKEDPDDPARPSICRDEFEKFLKNNVRENIKITSDLIEIGVGDANKLGFSQELDEDTTDCIKIIGTIIQGISGNYILVTSEMTGGPEGRFGKAFIMPLEEYRREAPIKGWPINKSIWQFSNFSGIPDFFTKLDLSELVSNITRRISEAIKR
jgi:hypothetical protein